jgi:hypothetical protein
VEKKILQLIPLCLMLALLAVGCAKTNQAEVAATPASAVQQEPTVYEGEINGVSERAKSISIMVGKGDQAKAMMVKFDDTTKGVKQAKKGVAAKITYEVRGTDAYATEVQLKLAKLPAGVTEIKTAELQKLISDQVKIFLVDSRPLARFNQSHLPGAHAIPVPMLEEKHMAVLPKEKDFPLVFYCGGPT